MVRLLQFLLVVGCALPLYAQTNSLQGHLEAYAKTYSLSLIYSPTALPDTVFAFAKPAGDTRAEILDQLVLPHGLAYTILGKQLIVTRGGGLGFSVSGYIEDAITEERLVGATVAVLDDQRGDISNGYGYFSILGVKDNSRLVISYVGYPNDTISVQRLTSRNKIIRLVPSYLLRTVEVLAPQDKAVSLPETGRALPPQVLDDTELSIGARDVNIWLAQMPGVQTGPSGFGGYSFRGADPSQNLILLDEATLYLPSHAAGFTSAVPGHAIRSISVQKDAGEASYGDRVGGVVDIRLKEGSRDEARTSLSVGATDVYGATEGPLGKGSYFVTGRRGLADFWLDALRPSVQPAESRIPDINFLYYDFMGKVNYPIGDRHRIYASVYLGRDQYKDQDEVFTREDQMLDAFLDQSRRSWGNNIATLRHTATVGTRVFVSTTATLSEFSYEADDYFLLREDISSSIERFTVSQSQFATNLLDIGLKQQLEYAVRAGVRMTFGASILAHRFRVGTRTSTIDRALNIDSTFVNLNELSTSDLPELRTYEISGHYSAKLQPTDQIDATMGFRVTSQISDGRPLFAVLPRIDLRYKLTPQMNVDINMGDARQFIHSISTQNPGLPRDLWVPSVAGLKPQRSRYASLGYSYLAASGASFASSVYYQRLDGLARFGNNFASLTLNQWQQQVRLGSGESVGLEMEGVVPVKRFRLGAAYTFARSSRKYADAFGEITQEERFRLDRRHVGRITARFQANQAWSLGATWTVGSGLPSRLPTRNGATPRIPNTNVPLTNSWEYDGPQIELKPYHSLDLGARREVTRDEVVYRFSFGIQNVYLRKNALFLNLQRTSDVNPGESNYRLTQITMLPILPFFRYTITF